MMVFTNDEADIQNIVNFFSMTIVVRQPFQYQTTQYGLCRWVDELCTASQSLQIIQERRSDPHTGALEELSTYLQHYVVDVLWQLETLKDIAHLRHNVNIARQNRIESSICTYMSTDPYNTYTWIHIYRERHRERSPKLVQPRNAKLDSHRKLVSSSNHTLSKSTHFDTQ